MGSQPCPAGHSALEVQCVFAGTDVVVAAVAPDGGAAVTIAADDVGGAGGIQLPAPHVSPEGQAWPQLPQLFTSAVTSTQVLPHNF